MIPVMPKPLPRYVCRQVTRHGRTVFYFRRERHGKRIRIKATFGSTEWDAEYAGLLLAYATPQPAKSNAKAGTLRWLWGQYRKTTAWSDLSLATRKQRENIMKHVLDDNGGKGGDMPYAAVTQKHVVDGRDRRRETPAQARNFLDAMRGLFRWALEKQFMTVDPTAQVKSPKRVNGEGFTAWTEVDVALYHARWPRGTKERVWMDVLLYTGLRRGDAVRLGKQHLRNGEATIRTEKSKFEVEITIPVVPELQTTLDVGPTGDLAFICGERGQPLIKESFGNLFKSACRAAGVIGRKKNAHGVRKLAATLFAERGANEAQLDAWFGWRGGGMAALYTRKANRRRMSKGMGHLLSQNTAANDE
jgi:integrase